MSNGQGFFYSVFQGNKLNNNDVQGILNYVKSMDAGAKHAEAFSANLTNCSVAAQKYVKDAHKAGKSTEQISAGLKDVVKTGGGFKNAIANIGSTFLNSLIGAGIGVAINLIIAGITNLVKAADEAKKKAVENGSDRYDELTEKLRSVDDQISENNKSQAEWNATIRNIPMDRLKEYLDIADAIATRVKSYVERLSYVNGESTWA